MPSCLRDVIDSVPARALGTIAAVAARLPPGFLPQSNRGCQPMSVKRAAWRAQSIAQAFYDERFIPT